MSQAHSSPTRKIIHIDMDAFYASVEQRDHPEYRGKPLIVGGSPEGRGGVVATASYEARRYGVRSAMPSKEARRLCPDAIFVRPDFEQYKKVSRSIREIFGRYTDLVEPLSLDEAFLDVSMDKRGIGSALVIASEIREAIRGELQLTASAGVSVNKFVAKIASDMNKPDGLTFVAPDQVPGFIAALPVARFFGVGRVTAAKMARLDLHTGADLLRQSEAFLVRHFGKAGRFYYQIARGIDERPVQPQRAAKSVGAEDTFAADLFVVQDITEALLKLAGIVAQRLERQQLKGRTITVKIRYSDFRQITRSHSLEQGTGDEASIAAIALQLFNDSGSEGKAVRLLGISLSNLAGPGSSTAALLLNGQQLSLF